jgi:D-alanine transfer protein
VVLYVRKIKALIFSVLLAWLLLLGAKAYYAVKVHELYYDKVGDDNSLTTSKSYILQSEASRINDNVFIFGSSALEWAKDFLTHISHVFNHRVVEYQPHLVGRAGFDQLAHILNIGALGSVLHGQKIVFIISSQWFTRQFFDDDNLNINNSPLFYYRFFVNPELSFHLKNTVARIVENLVAIKKNLITP